MRAPFGSDSTDLCSEEKEIISSDNGNEIHGIVRNLERSHTHKTAIFGICLEDLMGTSEQVVPKIPFILTRICDFIETHGMHQKSLFLNFEEIAEVENMKIEFIESGDAALENSGNVASVAKLLIIFLEELPEPLIPVSAQFDLIKDMNRLTLCTSDWLINLKANLKKLPDSAYQVLKYLSYFLLRVTFHKEYNGMSSNSLAEIFGPLIFRPVSNDQQKLLIYQDIVNCFVKDYHNIFENDEKMTYESVPYFELCCQSPKIPKQLYPSSVMPLVTLSPLSVMIPNTDDIKIDKSKKENVPILLIEGLCDKQFECDSFLNNESCKKEIVTRKRKERRFSGEDAQQRSSSEERPSKNALITVGLVDTMRRCNSHEEVVEYGSENNSPSYENFENKKKCQFTDFYKMNNEDNNPTTSSLHLPTAKRREIDINHKSHVEDFGKIRNKSATFVQNSVAESVTQNARNIDTFQTLPDKIFHVPRSESVPIPTSNNMCSNNADLSLNWSMLFEDSEPLRAESGFNLYKEEDTNEDEILLSPSVQSLRKSNSYEAPLSPSAYRSYLSYRSTHLDPSVPPSPPVEQEDFAKKLVKSSNVLDSIKQLTKKIHGIKKRLRKFDERFEAEFGFKPSHAEKSQNPEAKKMLTDLYKARKELKGLKEEARLELVGSTWHAAHFPHVLEDTTNQFLHEDNISKSSVENLLGVTMKTLNDDRILANRPEAFDDMTCDQVKDEKVAIQKALLNIEEKHGRPITKEQRETCRPLYDRYRCAKRLLVRSGSFPISGSKNKELYSELQPILEHETMDFSSRFNKSTPEKQNETHEKEKKDLNLEDKDIGDILRKEENNSSSFLTIKYDNSNLHELPLSEMLFEMEQIKCEKRNLRKLIKDFETDFFKKNGKKAQKEDKSQADYLYNEYRHVKARLRLLEALISKHDQHQLM